MRLFEFRVGAILLASGHGRNRRPCIHRIPGATVHDLLSWRVAAMVATTQNWAAHNASRVTAALRLELVSELHLGAERRGGNSTAAGRVWRGLHHPLGRVARQNQVAEARPTRRQSRLMCWM